MSKQKHGKRKSGQRVGLSTTSKIAVGLTLLTSMAAGAYFALRRPHSNSENAAVADLTLPKNDLIYTHSAQEVTLSDKQKSDLEDSVRFDVGIANDFIYEQATFQDWVVLCRDTKKTRRIISAQVEFMDLFFKYVNHPDFVKPDLDIRIPQKQAELKQRPADGSIPVYFLEDMGTTLTVQYSYLDFTGRRINGKSTRELLRSGEAVHYITFSIDDNWNYSIGENKDRAIYVCAKGTKVDQIASLGLEAGHVAVSHITTQNLDRHISAFLDGRKLRPDDGGAINRLFGVNMDYEEGLIHALGFGCFKEEITRSNPLLGGVTLGDVQRKREYLLSHPDETYSKMPVLEGLLNKHGPTKTVDLYIGGGFLSFR